MEEHWEAGSTLQVTETPNAAELSRIHRALTARVTVELFDGVTLDNLNYDGRGTVQVDNGAVITTVTNGRIYVHAGGMVTAINGGYIRVEGGTVTAINGGYVEIYGGTVTAINDGTVRVYGGTVTAIDGGTVYVEDGCTVTGVTGGWIYAQGKIEHVTTGTIEAQGQAVIELDVAATTDPATGHVTAHNLTITGPRNRRLPVSVTIIGPHGKHLWPPPPFSIEEEGPAT